MQLPTRNPHSLTLILAFTLCALIAAPTFASSPSSIIHRPSSPASSPQTSDSYLPTATCPSGQCFTDVAPGNTFYDFVNALYLHDIISGYPCGSPGEPCDPQSRPYYRPSNSVTRAQMSKFTDLGRRNIADAVGNSLTMSGTTASLVISTTTNDYHKGINVTAYGGSTTGIFGQCLGIQCTGLEIQAFESGSYGAFISGDRGAVIRGYHEYIPALSVYASGDPEGTGASLTSDHYRGAEIDTNSSGSYALYIYHPATGAYGLATEHGAYINGNLLVTGSKSGYVVDIMQNVGPDPLQPGDVVTIAGTSPPVVGDIPVITVVKASTPYDTGVVGVVDAALYVPSPAVRATYLAEQQARRDAQDQNSRLLADPSSGPHTTQVPIPPATITDAEGTPHTVEGATTIPTNAYANVVTLGAYKTIRVDATYAPIRKGDLLVSSPTPGHAMKAADRTLSPGATIGKALADLDTGTALIPVMVTLK